MEGQLTPLLTWGGDANSEKMLLGRTFAHPDASINAQWFGEFAIMSKGQMVVEITAGEKGTMNMSFDGKHVRAAKSTVKAEYNSPTGVRLELTATENGEQATVESGDMRVRIFSSGAAKFARKSEQNKYSHLNLNFEFLPTKGRGIFAELAGLRPMSAATQALLKSPHETTRENNSDDDTIMTGGIRKATSLVGTYANQLKPIRDPTNHSAAGLREATALFGSAKGARRRANGVITPRGLTECVCPPPTSPPGIQWTAVYNVPPEMPPSAPGQPGGHDGGFNGPQLGDLSMHGPQLGRKAATTTTPKSYKGYSTITTPIVAKVDDTVDDAHRRTTLPKVDDTVDEPVDEQSVASKLARLVFGGSSNAKPDQDDRADLEPQSDSSSEPESDSTPANSGMLKLEMPDLAASKGRRVSN